MLNWSDGAQENIQKVFNWPNLNQIHTDLLEQGRIVHAELRPALEPYGIVDAEGNLTVPTIEMNETDPIFQISQILAMKVVKFIGVNMDRKGLCEEFRFSDEETAFVVTYHEWMWELMIYLIEKGFVELPFAFENPGEAEPQDIGRLIFTEKSPFNKGHPQYFAITHICVPPTHVRRHRYYMAIYSLPSSTMIDSFVPSMWFQIFVCRSLSLCLRFWA